MPVAFTWGEQVAKAKIVSILITLASIRLTKVLVKKTKFFS